MQNCRKIKENRKKHLRRSVFAFLSALILLSLLLSGCTEIRITSPLDKRTLIEIDDVRCSMGTGVLALLEAREEYGSTQPDGFWNLAIDRTDMKTYVKEAATDELIRYTAAQVMAKDMTVFLTEEENQKAKEDAAQLIRSLRNLYDLNIYQVSEEDAADLFLKRTYYNKVFNKLSENILMEISEADTKAIWIKYVFIPMQDGVEVAERMRNEIRGGTDFTAVCDKYGYSVEEYAPLIKGVLPTALDTYAFALRDNEISEIIETRDGYYIIYCLEDYMVSESMANRNKVISDGRQERFDAAYETFAASSKMRFNTAEWEKLDVGSME